MKKLLPALTLTLLSTSVFAGPAYDNGHCLTCAITSPDSNVVLEIVQNHETMEMSTLFTVHTDIECDSTNEENRPYGTMLVNDMAISFSTACQDKIHYIYPSYEDGQDLLSDIVQSSEYLKFEHTKGKYTFNIRYDKLNTDMLKFRNGI